MDNEQERENLRLEQKVAEEAYDLLISASIYLYDPVIFSEKVLQFIKDRQEKTTEPAQLLGSDLNGF